MRVYYNNNGNIHSYDSEEAYEQYARYDKDGNDRGMVLVTREEAEAITAERMVNEELGRVAALTIPERIAHMEGLANSMIKIEQKNEKYFYGNGFVNGDKSMRRYPNHPDAVKLAVWEVKIWAQIEKWVKSIHDGPVDASAFTTIFISENLPKIGHGNN